MVEFLIERESHGKPVVPASETPGSAPPETLAKLIRIPYFCEAYWRDGIDPYDFGNHEAFINACNEANSAHRRLTDYRVRLCPRGKAVQPLAQCRPGRRIRGVGMNKMVGLWAHPRSRSTVLERVFIERGDLKCSTSPSRTWRFPRRRRSCSDEWDHSAPTTYQGIKAQPLEAKGRGNVFHKDMVLPPPG